MLIMLRILSIIPTISHGWNNGGGVHHWTDPSGRAWHARRHTHKDTHRSSIRTWIICAVCVAHVLIKSGRTCPFKSAQFSPLFPPGHPLGVCICLCCVASCSKSESDKRHCRELRIRDAFKCCMWASVCVCVCVSRQLNRQADKQQTHCVLFIV